MAIVKPKGKDSVRKRKKQGISVSSIQIQFTNWGKQDRSMIDHKQAQTDYAVITFWATWGVQKHVTVKLKASMCITVSLILFCMYFPGYLSVSCRLLPRDKEMDRKKPWTAGTVYIRRVLDKSWGNINACISLARTRQEELDCKLLPVYRLPSWSQAMEHIFTYIYTRFIPLQSLASSPPQDVFI